MPDRPLRGHHAIVTGGGRGIGAAIAAELARMGAALTITGRDMHVLRETTDRLAAKHETDVGAIRCDVTDAADVQAAFADAQRKRGGAHILVNNAGQAEGRPFLDTDLELWERMLAVNLTGAFLCTQQVLGGMLRAGSGRIINVASTSGLKGYRNIAAYCASKHGLVGLTRALAAETARAGITVNAVCPAYTDTDMAKRAVDNVVRDMDRTEDEARALLARAIRRGSLITPAEVAGTVAWLCTPAASGINGQAITIAGGEI